MRTLPDAMIRLLAPFAPLFSRRVWMHAQLLVMGAILAPGTRTVSAILRVLGLSQQRPFQQYHRVLSRAVWSSLAVSRVLLARLIVTFVPTGPLIFGLDETIERRWGAKIAARGIYRDAARSSDSHLVKTSGLRWVTLHLLVELPWTERVWALPVLTALAPSERYHQTRGMRHKTLTDWARQLTLQARRWWPEREIIVVADSNYAALDLLGALSQRRKPVHLVTRLRLDAALYAPAPARQPGQIGRPRLKGERLPTLQARLEDPSTVWTRVRVADWYDHGARELEIASETAVWYHTGKAPVPIRWVLVRDPDDAFPPQALLSTDLAADPVALLTWYSWRWQVEVTYQEVRRHLGVETQRQWSELAIARTTPALLGLYSLVTLLAHEHLARSPATLRQASWYVKSQPTFGDALALVRRDIWAHLDFSRSAAEDDTVKVSRALLEHLTETLCYAA